MTLNIEQDRLAFGVAEAAKALGVSPVTLYRAEQSGKIKFTRACGRTLITRDELLRFLHDGLEAPPRLIGSAIPHVKEAVQAARVAAHARRKRGRPRKIVTPKQET
jgi:excisionase family DNA binding protein